MPLYTQRPMCSTKEPKRRRGTSPMVKSRSRVMRAREIYLLGCVLKQLLSEGAGSGSGESRRRDALDDLALEEQEDDDERQSCQQGRGHVLRVLDAVGALDGLQAYGEGQTGVIVGGDERPQEVVQPPEENEDRDGGREGPGQGRGVL